MHILYHLQADSITPPADSDKSVSVKNNILCAMRNAFNDASSEELPLDPPYVRDVLNPVYGFESPAAVIRTAAAWNSDVCDGFRCALTAVTCNKPASQVQIQTDTTFTFDLVKWAKAIDNQFDPLGYHMVVHEDGKVNTLLYNGELDELKAKPEYWATAELVIKD